VALFLRDMTPNCGCPGFAWVSRFRSDAKLWVSRIRSRIRSVITTDAVRCAHQHPTRLRLLARVVTGQQHRLAVSVANPNNARPGDRDVGMRCAYPKLFGLTERDSESALKATASSPARARSGCACPLPLQPPFQSPPASGACHPDQSRPRPPPC